MSRIFEIADGYVRRVAEMNPISATYMGVPGYDDRMNDFSPEAAEAEARLERDTLAELESAPVEGESDRIARDAMADSLRLSLDRHDANEHFRSLSMIFSPVHSARQVFDLMPRDTEEAWKNIASRMALIPEAVDSYRATPGRGREARAGRGEAAGYRDRGAVRRMERGQPAGHESFFDGIADAFAESGVYSESLAVKLQDAARSANRGIADIARFLRESYIPNAAERDAVGEERYSLAARVYNGIELDLEETYRWGWEQLAWVESEMEEDPPRR